MRDISHKIKTFRQATARATLTVSPETLDRLRSGDLPKGDPLPIAKVAAIQAAKNTSQIIPYCHPLPVDYVGVTFDLGETTIDVTVTLKVIYKTGVEMEALTAASVAALTLYDMLKMIDDAMAITGVTLLEKRGGKTDFKEKRTEALRAAVLVMSDSIAAGHKSDASGRLIEERLHAEGVAVADYLVIPDDPDAIVETLTRYADTQGIDLVLTTGGTGMSPRDNTPEAMARVIEKEAPGISEMLRDYGQERMPYAMLSRGKAGIRGRTLIINLPGSKNGVRESLDALFPSVFHAFKILRGGPQSGHDAAKQTQSEAVHS
jgi:cyclic pyranopterin phosphate synthase